MKAKSILQSKTFWWSLCTGGLGVGAVVFPDLDKGIFNWVEFGKCVAIAFSTGLTVLARIEATQAIYTPDGMPGKDKSDFTQGQ